MIHTKIQIISDIHLGKGRETINIEPYADYLLVGGDIDEYASGFKLLRDFLNMVAPMFKKVVWILGNHEMMTSEHSFVTFSGVLRECEKIAEETETIFLHNNSYDLTDELTVIGSPLFSHIPDGFIERTGKKPFPRGMRLKLENRLLPKQVGYEEFNMLHEEAKAAIVRELELCALRGRKAIIITHYGPLAPLHTRAERDQAFEEKESEYAHYNTDEDMHEVLVKCKHLVALWIFGHCHTNSKFHFDSENIADSEESWGFDVVSNQLGHSHKPSKTTTFDPNYTYDLITGRRIMHQQTEEQPVMVMEKELELELELEKGTSPTDDSNLEYSNNTEDSSEHNKPLINEK